LPASRQGRDPSMRGKITKRTVDATEPGEKDVFL
jgi:hypothetical protein